MTSGKKKLIVRIVNWYIDTKKEGLYCTRAAKVSKKPQNEGSSLNFNDWNCFWGAFKVSRYETSKLNYA